MFLFCDQMFLLGRKLSSFLCKTLTLIHFPVTCEPLSLENGLVHYTTSAVNEQYLVTTVASFSCNSGFYQISTNSRTCQTSGNWTGQNSVCEGNYYSFCSNTLFEEGSFLFVINIISNVRMSFKKYFTRILLFHL